MGTSFTGSREGVIPGYPDLPLIVRQRCTCDFCALITRPKVSNLSQRRPEPVDGGLQLSNLRLPIANDPASKPHRFLLPY